MCKRFNAESFLFACIQMKIPLPYKDDTFTFREKVEWLREKMEHCPKRVTRQKWSEMTWLYAFPWRDEQLHILQTYQTMIDSDTRKRIMVIQAVFGGGKTTMLIALLYDLILQQSATCQDIFVCAFNVAIKNEIRKRCKPIGKIYPRTFDSLVYEICKELEYPDLLCQNFDEKRRFVQLHLSSITEKTNVKYVMVDESQDLDFLAFQILWKRFPSAYFLFVGDIFQSIQKEPRESLLWNLLQDDTNRTIQCRMQDTPRVPPMILREIQHALTCFYPEFSETIQYWTSSSHQMGTKIRWTSFKSYRTVLSDMMMFLQDHPHHECMILVFSSAITVKGSLGDVSRVRKFLIDQGISVNMNHKNMVHDAVFLSTVQSSKGLERPHVFCFLSFPLERAFAQFSTDLLMNLITVAMSRCKSTMWFQIPASDERFSPILEFYKNCPYQIENTEDLVFNKRLMLEKEQGITEILRLQILSFSTRRFLKKQSHLVQKHPIISTNLKNIKTQIRTEEEATFIGILFETLLLTYWTNEWMDAKSLLVSANEDALYQAFLPQIMTLRTNYIRYIQSHPYSAAVQMKGCYLYAKCLLAKQHKLFVNLSTNLMTQITNHWKEIIVHVEPIRPHKQIKTQYNLGMAFVTGIADAVIPSSENQSLVVYEIKASKAKDWMEQALLQAILYGVCLGQKRFTIHLVNVFSSHVQTLQVYLDDVHQTRSRIMEDVRQWNLNCYLAKNRSLHDPNRKTLNIHNMYFLDGRIDPPSLFLFEITSPTKTTRIKSVQGQEEVDKFLNEEMVHLCSLLHIRKLIIGRHLYLLPALKRLPIPVCVLGSESHPISCPQWFKFIEKCDWFDPSVSLENKKTFLDWDIVQCSFMIQWADICDRFNIN